MLTARNQNTFLNKEFEPIKLTKRPLTQRHKKAQSNIPQLPQNFFITQDPTNPPKKLYLDDNTLTLATDRTKRTDTKSSALGNVSDNRVKGILNRLSSTMEKLKKASDSCERTIASNSRGYHKHSRSSATFALTQATFDTTLQNPNTTKTSALLNNFLSMNESEFFAPQTTMAMNKAALSIDLNPHALAISENLWGQVNTGRNYSNELKYEIERKKKELEQVKAVAEELDRKLNNTALEMRIELLNKEIEKAHEKIEVAEYYQESLDYVIDSKRQDLLLGWHKFKQYYGPFEKAGIKLDKNIEEIIKLSKTMLHQADEFKTLQEQSNANRKNRLIIQERRSEGLVKLENLENRLHLEEAYNTKRNDLIIKTKREIETTRIVQLEKQERINKKKEMALLDLLQAFESDFDKLSSVSKQFANKEDYIRYFEELEENNRDLESKLESLNEEVNLKAKIELPALRDELNLLKTSQEQDKGDSEIRALKNTIQAKHKRNETLEKKVNFKQTMLSDATRGVMTVFYKLLNNKKELGIDKLETVKIKEASLGDILLLTGEILEAVKKANKEPSIVRSEPQSLDSFSQEELA